MSQNPKATQEDLKQVQKKIILSRKEYEAIKYAQEHQETKEYFEELKTKPFVLPKKLKPIQIETAIVHIASSFLSMGMDISNPKNLSIKDTDSPHTVTLKKILQDISKKSQIFKKDINKNVAMAQTIFKNLETKIKKEILKPTAPRGRYDKRCRLNPDGDLEANAVLLCMTLIKEHKQLFNKKIHLQYKLADEVIQGLKENKTKGYENARILAKKYVYELHNL